MAQSISYSKSNHVATITFNRPDHMNSFNRVMADELEMITDEVRLDDEVRAVLLNGAGQLFMAGGDIHYFQDNIEHLPEGVRKMVRTLNASIINLTWMEKPVLAAVHGSVAGVGMSFMMATDLVIAAETTKFTMAYSGLGITADGGASFNLPRLVGTKKAMEWLLLPDMFDAETAKQFGLINWVVKDESLVEKAQQMALRLANGPSQSYKRIKCLVNQTWHNTLESQLEWEGKAFEDCSATNDFREGVKAFLSKKRPEFSGT